MGKGVLGTAVKMANDAHEYGYTGALAATALAGTLAMQSPETQAANRFAQSRTQKKGYWDARRQELLNMVTNNGHIGALETLASVGSAMANMSLQGLSGMGALARGQGLDQAVANTQHQFIPQYTPQSNAGQAALQGMAQGMGMAEQAVGSASEALGGTQHPIKGLQDNIFNWTGSPAAATAAGVLPELAL